MSWLDYQFYFPNITMRQLAQLSTYLMPPFFEETPEMTARRIELLKYILGRKPDKVQFPVMAAIVDRSDLIAEYMSGHGGLTPAEIHEITSIISRLGNRTSLEYLSTLCAKSIRSEM